MKIKVANKTKIIDLMKTCEDEVINKENNLNNIRKLKVIKIVDLQDILLNQFDKQVEVEQKM